MTGRVLVNSVEQPDSCGLPASPSVLAYDDDDSNGGVGWHVPDTMEVSTEVYPWLVRPLGYNKIPKHSQLTL